MAQKILSAFLISASLIIAGCATAHSQNPPGGNEIFAGRYVYTGYGINLSTKWPVGWPELLPPSFPLPQQVPYFENGSIVADGAGHFTQCGSFTSGAVVSAMIDTSKMPNLHPLASSSGGINCDDWTYGLQNFMGEAKSPIGDSMYVFCTESGKVCQGVNNTPGGFAWVQRMERE